ncbi:MAG: hypothetical protein ACJATA_000406 [Sphingobacteriales bacterium]|jgi:hypothetical protein
MSTKLSAIILSLIFLLTSCGTLDLAQIQKEAEKALGSTSNPLTNEKVVLGLKQALEIGSQNAANKVSATDGYLKNPRLFIPFPPEALKAEEKLRQLGFDKLVDDFVLSINRAAEDAGKEAAPIFINAVKNISIQDGFTILKGSNDAATNYLRDNTSSQLKEAFQPKISNSLSKVNATKYWTDVISTYNKIPGITDINPSLDGYVTDLAIKGLFVVVENEEEKIREDPAARVTELLKDVFGSVTK